MKLWKIVFGFLILVCVAVWLAVLASPAANLHLIACNVGEGDAVLVTYRSFQILTDGGPDNKVLDCLGKYVPFWDREIEVVILTHPDKDHYQGLVDVLKRYQVDYFWYSMPPTGTPLEGLLEKGVGGQGITSQRVERGTQLRVGKIQLDVLQPTKGTETIDTNKASMISLLRYGDFKALLTGDMVSAVSDRLAVNWPFGPINYIKIPHHGSKNGLTAKLVQALKPKLAVISVGKNSYGHPHEETLKILSDNDITILRTDEMGDIEIISDGKSYWLKR